MKTLEAKLNISFIVIPLGFSLIVLSISIVDALPKYIMMSAGAIGIIGALFYANRIYNKLEKIEETNQQEQARLAQQRFDELINEVRGFRNDLREIDTHIENLKNN